MGKYGVRCMCYNNRHSISGRCHHTVDKNHDYCDDCIKECGRRTQMPDNGTIITVKSFAFTNRAGGTGMSNWSWNPKFEGLARVEIVEQWSDPETGQRFICKSADKKLDEYMEATASLDDKRIFTSEFEIVPEPNISTIIECITFIQNKLKLDKRDAAKVILGGMVLEEVDNLMDDHDNFTYAQAILGWSTPYSIINLQDWLDQLDAHERTNESITAVLTSWATNGKELLDDMNNIGTYWKDKLK